MGPPLRVSLGGWRHLARRFFDVLRAPPLSPREQSEVAALLRPAEAVHFWRQGAADQRHGLEAARLVLREEPGRRDLARAALLHDVGKLEAGLGPVGRAVASALAQLRLPVTGRLRSYLLHGEIGADLLEEAGSEPDVVAFARHHHQDRPPSVPEEAWRLLQAADRERMTSTRRREPIR